MHVKGYTRASRDCSDVDEYFHGDRAAFAADLDYLVSIVPNTAATVRLVDATLLAALPPRAVFVNPGRGKVVDEAALADALQSGRLAGAVLDVFQQEPLPPDHVFWRTPNVLITSHTAAISFPKDIAPVFIDELPAAHRRRAAEVSSGLRRRILIDASMLIAPCIFTEDIKLRLSALLNLLVLR